jgi:hypothetical protein
MPQLQPGRGFDAGWHAVRAAAVAVGRDPDALGLEGQVRVAPDQLGRAPERAARWRDAGADAVMVNPLRASAQWPHGHLDLLLRAADALG